MFIWIIGSCISSRNYTITTHFLAALEIHDRYTNEISNKLTLDDVDIAQEPLKDSLRSLQLLESNRNVR